MAQRFKDWKQENGGFTAYCVVLCCWFGVMTALETGSIQQGVLVGIAVVAAPFLASFMVVVLLNVLGLGSWLCEFVSKPWKRTEPK